MNIEYLREFVSLASSLSFNETARQFYISQSVLSKHIASMEKELGAKFVNIEYLREFVSLASSLSFNETARQFYISQSVLSKHIASMEKELGAKLFSRDSHHVRLTKCGQAFYEEAEIIIGSFDRATSRIAAINQSFETVVRIGYLRNASRPFLSFFLKKMRKERPDIRIDVTCMEYGELFTAMNSRRIDIGFAIDLDPGMRAKCTTMRKERPDIRIDVTCMEYGELFTAMNSRRIDIGFAIDLDPGMRAKCTTMPLYEDQFYAVVSRDHPLAFFEQGVESVQLCGQKLLLPEPTAYPGMSDFVNTLLPDHCTALKRAYYSDVDTAFLDVNIEGYVFFSSGHNIPVFGDQAAFIPILDKQTSYSVSAMWLADTSARIIEPCLPILENVREYMKTRQAPAKTRP